MDGTAPLLSVEVRHLEGALGRPDPNGGVLSHFEAPYVMYSVAMAPSPAAVPAIDGRIAEIRPRPGRGSRAARTSTSPSKADASTLFPGGNYERLVEIRAEVDPDGVFRAKHPID